MTKLKEYILLARPDQYVKNGFVLLPLFFGQKLHDLDPLLAALGAFMAFCLASSCVYAFNDIRDVDSDRRHPVKKNRPLASGALSKTGAWIYLTLLLVASLLISFIFLNREFLIFLAGYLLLNAAYSLALKHLAIIDVVCIAVGFVLRVFAGGAAAGVYISHWLILMTFLLALFLAMAKRRDDVVLAGEGLSLRKSLDGYNLEFVSSSLVLLAAVLIVVYVLYTVSPEIRARHHSDKLYLTTLGAVVGLLRYMQLTLVEGNSGPPTAVFWKDIFLQAVVVLWVISLYFILYGI